MSNTGKPFEQTTMKILKELATKHPMKVHRFADSHAARNIMTSAPGDFLVVKSGVPILMEVKSSEQEGVSFGSRFRSMVTSSQYAEARLWIRAGGVSMFMFHNIHDDAYEVYSGADLVEVYSQKRVKIDPVFPTAYGKLEYKLLLMDALMIPRGDDHG